MAVECCVGMGEMPTFMLSALSHEDQPQCRLLANSSVKWTGDCWRPPLSVSIAVLLGGYCRMGKIEAGKRW